MDLINQDVIMALVDSSGLDEIRDILLNSSSDSSKSSDDEEDAEETPIKKLRKDPTFFEEIERYDDINFKQTFHMNRTTFEVSTSIILRQ